ncbi:MAG: ABC transporter permease [Anaerolineales bacterium]|jgi:ABC-2 type transport system permease protein
MSKGVQRLRALLYKETMQLLRDRRTLALFFLLPLVELFLFAYAVTMTVDHLPTALVDQSLDHRSRDFVQALVDSGYFDIKLTLQNEQQVRAAMDAGTVKAGVVIPPNFAADVSSGKGKALILLDGSDSFSVQSGYRAASAIAQQYSFNLTTQEVPASAIGAGSLPVTILTRVLYNPDLKDLVFILPGLIALIIQNIIVAHSAMAFVREREVGTLEQLLASPARPIEMMVAKLIPGVLVVILDMVVILLLGVFWFGVPFNGNIGLFGVLSILFIVSGMGLGLLISTLAKTQRQAQQFTNLLNLLAMLLTGFIYPRLMMPLWTRIIGDLVPLTFYISIVRGIITKGVGISFLWGNALALAVYSIVSLLLASSVTKRRLD